VSTAVGRTVGELDAMDAAAFIAAMAPLFEGALRFLDRLAAARPFGSAAALFEAARAIATAMPEGEQVELLDAHPRIGAPPGSVSALSRREQGYDRERRDGVEASGNRTIGMDVGRTDLARTLETLNDAYEARFGFRFVVFVAGRPREAIVPELKRRLREDRGTELLVGLTAVMDIARDRWRVLGAEGADG
jgi:2-oxo-4-hydroxy-4-carboxy--5-ureidoimidazoline (OHCU) decarboxylase